MIGLEAKAKYLPKVKIPIVTLARAVSREGKKNNGFQRYTLRDLNVE